MVNHASAIGCYFYDPEGNCADDAIVAEIDRLWQRVRDIGLGERMPEEPPTLQF